jgi:signal transduction histidine kinase
MKDWRLNSIAARIAVTIVLAIVSGIALSLLFGLGRNYLVDVQGFQDRSDSRIFMSRFGILNLNRHSNLPMLSTRLATVARIVGRASPADRPAVIAAMVGDGLGVQIRDQPTLGLDHDDSFVCLLHDLIEFQVQSAPDAVRVAIRHESAVRSGSGTLDRILVEIALPDGRWLAVTASDFVRGEQSLPIVLLALIGLVIAALSVWTARRLTRPISAFASAAERFGRGTEPVPLAESGPRELRAAIRAFNQMQERLRRFVDDRTQMVAAMSHDLKTPLTRLRLRAELIRNVPQQRKMLSDLDEMAAMIESTLDFVRDDMKREAPLLVDLGALVESAGENAIDAGGEVEVFTTQGINVTCRPTAISRAVANLIDNAVKYGGRARVAVDHRGDRVVITVDDDGPGIPEHEREKVFAPFYRLESSRNRDTGGVGLGLAVARTNVREHGGDVTLAAAESGGLRARLELPVDGAIEGTTAAAAATGARGGRATISARGPSDRTLRSAACP